MDNPELRTRLIEWYLWRLGDRMFRHEALEWTATWARRSRRCFRIYGNGWEKHPTLAAFAAGPAENGRELLCIHRASKINLQLMPAGFIHQRALDGLAGGGFFLSRRTKRDLLGCTLRTLVKRMEELGIASTRTLVDSGDAVLQQSLRAFVGDALTIADRNSDFFYRCILGAAELPYPDELFPGFERIMFDSEADFAAKADRFVQDESQRRSIAAEMRQVVVDRLSYRPTIDRFLHAMAAYLGDPSHGG